MPARGTSLDSSQPPLVYISLMRNARFVTISSQQRAGSPSKNLRILTQFEAERPENQAAGAGGRRQENAFSIFHFPLVNLAGSESMVNRPWVPNAKMKNCK